MLALYNLENLRRTIPLTEVCLPHGVGDRTVHGRELEGWWQRTRMKTIPKIAKVAGIVLLLAGGLCASRYSMICPVHHDLAYATGQVRANGNECEYGHSLAKGKMHKFWAICDQLGLEGASRAYVRTGFQSWTTRLSWVERHLVGNVVDY